MGGNDSGVIERISSASILDKTDWRKTIHRCLENCIKSEKTESFNDNVQRLISAVSATYPGFDAKGIINKYVEELNDEFEREVTKWAIKHPDEWFHPIKRKMNQMIFNQKYSKELFEFVKDLLARKRILLYGVRQVSGGIQMKDTEQYHA